MNVIVLVAGPIENPLELVVVATEAEVGSWRTNNWLGKGLVPFRQGQGFLLVRGAVGADFGNFQVLTTNKPSSVRQARDRERRREAVVFPNDCTVELLLTDGEPGSKFRPPGVVWALCVFDDLCNDYDSVCFRPNRHFRMGNR